MRLCRCRLSELLNNVPTAVQDVSLTPVGKSYQNPGWLAADDHGVYFRKGYLRLAPMISSMLYFLGIGAQKAGTTWLYRSLQLHPRLGFPAGKEVHFWDKHRDRGIEWYRNQFSGDDDRLHGDITPAYAILEPAVIREIRQEFPALRLIYILRNPIERAWSHAKMDLRTKGLGLADAPDGYFRKHFRHKNSLTRGDAEGSLRRWRAVFPAEQLLTLRFETLCHQPRELLRRCCDHLGVDDVYQDQPLPLPCNISPGALPPMLFEDLFTLYRESIVSLSAYLGEDLSEWLARQPA